MPQPSRDSQTPAPWRSPCIVVGLCLLALVAAAGLLRRGASEGNPARLVLCLLAVEAVAIGLAAPFLGVRGAKAPLRLVLLPVAAIALIGLTLCAVAGRGSVALARLAWAQVFLAAFGWLLASLAMALTSFRVRGTTAQAIASIVALAMLGQVFFANTLVEAATGHRAKMLIIDAVLWTNPWLIVGGSILDADPVRSPFYEASVISYYGFQYPCSGIAAVWLRALVLAAAYGVCGVGLYALARLKWRPESVH